MPTKAELLAVRETLRDVDLHLSTAIAGLRTLKGNDESSRLSRNMSNRLFYELRVLLEIRGTLDWILKTDFSHDVPEENT